MKKISIKTSKQKIEFGVKNIKYFLGKNQQKKYEVIKTIKKCFNKYDDSEYALEKNENKKLLINDIAPNLRKWLYFEINHMFDINSDLKLGSKSMILKMFSGLFDEIEYNDIVNTIDILLKDLVEELNDDLIKIFSKYNIKLMSEELTFKNIFKLFLAVLIKDDLNVCECDLDYDDYILLQLKILETIAESHLDFNVMCILELPIITPLINEYLSTIDIDNLIIVVNSTDKHLSIETINDVIYFNNQIIDLSDDVAIYNNIILNMEARHSLDEIQEELFYFIRNNEYKSDLKLSQII